MDTIRTVPAESRTVTPCLAFKLCRQRPNMLAAPPCQLYRLLRLESHCRCWSGSASGRSCRRRPHCSGHFMMMKQWRCPGLHSGGLTHAFTPFLPFGTTTNVPPVFPLRSTPYPHFRRVSVGSAPYIVVCTVLFFYPGIFFFSFFVDGNLVKCNDFVAFVLFFPEGGRARAPCRARALGSLYKLQGGHSHWALCIEPLVLCPLNKSP
jgi:hypothetical protein